MTADRDCPSGETLASFLLGKLPPEQEEALNVHLATCARCEAKARQIEQRSDSLIEALRQPPGPPPTSRPASTLVAPMAPTALPEPVPFHLEGYRIVRELGRGGMGVVYQAYQHRLKRLVAIKMILRGSLAGAEDRVRFLLEGELLARLNHPNFVQVYEVGTLELSPGTVQPYLVLEHVEGGSLKVRMAEQSLSPRDAAGLLLVLAKAVDAAHAHGIVHRDLKPANVLIAHDGTLKIGDFGLAKELDVNASLTPAGLVVGTPAYMAPEQAAGKSATVGPAADVYALGAIFYEMLAGRPPFAGDAPMEVVLQVLEQAPLPPRRLRREIPLDLETICLRCLEKEPRRRYARAGDLANDLESWLENRPIRARPVGRIERACKWAQRHPLPAALLLLLIVSLVTGSVASTYFGVSATNRARETLTALEKEEESRQRAEQATEAERWERYVAEIAAASSSLQLHNIGPARRALEAAPVSHRNWEWRHFASQLDGARSVLRGHEGEVWRVCFSKDGKRLASGSGDASVRLWDVATGKEVLAPLRFSSGGPLDVHFSPDGTRLVTGGDRVRVWNAATGDLRWEAEATKGGAYCPIWSADGKHLAGGGDDGWLRVRDAATGREVLHKPCNRLRHLVGFSPDSKHVAAGQVDFTVPVWEVATGKEVVVLRGHTALVTQITYSPDGRRIATSSRFPENGVRLWDAANGDLLAEGKGHDNEVSTLAFSPDGRRLASGSMDQTVRLWDGITGQARATLQGHTGFVNDLAFSPDGAALVSASADQTLRLWDPDAGRLIAVLRGHTQEVRSVQYNPGGDLIASASNDGTVRLWDAELVGRSGVLRGHSRFVYDVAFRPGGAEVASAGWDGKVRLWDPTTGRQTGELPHKTTIRPTDELPDKTTILIGLAYSPDGRRLAVAARHHGVCLWDVDARELIRVCHGSTGDWKTDSRPAFHPDGTLLAWGGLEGSVRLWDTATGEEAAALTGHKGACTDVAFHPEGKQLAAASEDGTVHLWDLTSRRMEAALHAAGHIYRLAYSADGRLLAAGSGNKTVRVWDVATQKEIALLPIGSPVYGMAFTPDRTRLACACADNTIRLWDLEKRREVAQLRGHDVYVHAVDFSPDGTRLASASGDRTVRIWDTLSAQDRAQVRPR